MGEIRLSKITKSKEEWKEILSDDVFEITRNQGTEPPFSGQYNQYYDDGIYVCVCCDKELFDSMEEADAYYSTPKNYKLLLSGEAGESLASKYTVKGLLILDEILTTIFYVIRSKFNKSYDVKLKSVLNSSEKWLRNLYMIKEIFGNKQKVKRNNKYKLKIDFDFPGWLSKNHLPFNQFIRNSTYEFNYDFKKLNYLHNEIQHLQT